MIQEQKECRICKGSLKTILDLGNIFPSAFLTDDELLSEGARAPLVLAKCDNCGLVQLQHTIDLDLMYRQYWYSSSLNKSMVSSLREIVQDIENREILKENDIVVDIGCNDGTMLNLFSTKVFKVGFDPALNLNKPDCDAFINDYFTSDAYKTQGWVVNKANYGAIIPTQAKVITAIAMFYDLPDPNKFVEDVKAVLHDDGIFVIQLTDLMSMIKVTAFDNICHEHLEYYRLLDIMNLLENHGLQVIDVSYNLVNGGSVRITACHGDRYPASPNVTMALVDETNFLYSHDLEYFKRNIETVKTKVKGFLAWANSHGHSVFLLGASTKGNTFLQVCGITDLDVPYAAEVNKDKFGLRTAGSNIKIISEDEALIKHPKYFLVPVWHFRDNILMNPKFQDYLNSDGGLVFPLPTFRIYTKKGGFDL